MTDRKGYAALLQAWDVKSETSIDSAKWSEVEAAVLEADEAIKAANEALFGVAVDLIDLYANHVVQAGSVQLRVADLRQLLYLGPDGVGFVIQLLSRFASPEVK